MAKKEKVHGLFAVNKPKGITIQQVLEFINRTFRRHAEATRPEMTRRQVVELGCCISSTTKNWCTGVFVIGVNQGNRLLKEQEKMNEVIHATGMLGFSTTTNDFRGTLIDTIPASHISRETIADFLPKLVGKVYEREISKTASAPPPSERPPWISHLSTFGKKKKKKLLKEYNRPTPSSKIIEYTAPTKIYRLELKDFSMLHSYHPPLTIEEMKFNEKTEKPFDSYASYLSPEDEQWEEDVRKNPTGSLTEILTPLAKRSFLTPSANNPISQKAAASQSTSPLSNLIKSAKTSQNPIFKVEIECFPNTPIEKVIDDIGRSLNSAAYLLDVERIKQGDFKLYEDTLEWDECTSFDNIYDSMNDWIRKVRKRELERQLG